MPRPHVDPELAGGLRDWLENALAGSAANLPQTSTVIRVSQQVLAATEARGTLLGRPADQRRSADDDLLRTLVRCIFRQWVTIRRLGQPMDDALAALSVSGDPGGAVEAVNSLSPEKRQSLSKELAGHAELITATWPALCPAWYPRTNERISLPLCGGRILIGGVVDVVIGAQAADEATVCIVQVDTAALKGRDASADLHFYALLETLRAGAPPSRVARYSTATGELNVETVDEHVLVGALLKTVEAAEQACAAQIAAAVVGAGSPI